VRRLLKSIKPVETKELKTGKTTSNNKTNLFSFAQWWIIQEFASQYGINELSKRLT
jgi:hypothetical protein